MNIEKWTQEIKDTFVKLLENRFEENMERHPTVIWSDVISALNSKDELIQRIYKMEETGGEPDVFMFKDEGLKLYYVDFSKESPIGRRNLCYDQAALEGRKNNKPIGSAMQWADEIGIQLLSEDEYFELQKFGPFDEKTSSWILTPDGVRSKGGAIFGDYKFGRTFIFHNGADSYYGARGFRGKCLIV